MSSCLQCFYLVFSLSLFKLSWLQHTKSLNLSLSSPLSARMLYFSLQHPSFALENRQRIQLRCLSVNNGLLKSIEMKQTVIVWKQTRRGDGQYYAQMYAIGKVRKISIKTKEKGRKKRATDQGYSSILITDDGVGRLDKCRQTQESPNITSPWRRFYFSFKWLQTNSINDVGLWCRGEKSRS